MLSILRSHELGTRTNSRRNHSAVAEYIPCSLDRLLPNVIGVLVLIKVLCDHNITVGSRDAQRRFTVGAGITDEPANRDVHPIVGMFGIMAQDHAVLVSSD